MAGGCLQSSEPGLLPVIAFSAHHNSKTVRQAYALGAHSFISKLLNLTDWESYFKRLGTYWLDTVTLPFAY